MLGGSPFLVVGVLAEQGPGLELQRPRQREGASSPARPSGRSRARSTSTTSIYQPTVAARGRGGHRRRARASSRGGQRFDPEDKEALLGLGHDGEVQVLRRSSSSSFRLFLGIIGSLHAHRRRHRRLEHHERRRRGAHQGDRHQDGARREATAGSCGSSCSRRSSSPAMGGAARLRDLLRASAPSSRSSASTEYVGDPELSLSVAALTAAILGAHRPPRRLLPGARRLAARPRRGDEAVRHGDEARLCRRPPPLPRSARLQKKRATLTIASIAWGTVTILLLLAFGEGLKRQMLVQRPGDGENLAIMWPGETSKP